MPLDGDHPRTRRTNNRSHHLQGQGEVENSALLRLSFRQKAAQAWQIPVADKQEDDDEREIKGNGGGRVGSKQWKGAVGCLLCLAWCLFKHRQVVMFLSTQQQFQETYIHSRTGSRFMSSPPACPDIPHRPALVPVLDIVANWNPNNVTVPPRHYHSLCRFDYQTEYAKALRYQEADVPFVVYNVPELEATVAKWATPGYLQNLLGKDNTTYEVRVSNSSHFMYFTESNTRRSGPDDFVPPTRTERWTYAQWVDMLRLRDGEMLNAHEISGAHLQHHYYYFQVLGDNNKALREDMAIYTTPKPGNSLFPTKQTFNCMFGLPAHIAEAHFDGNPNIVAVAKGARRWVLAPPSECRNAYLLPEGHPSARHSQVDWATPDLATYPLFAQMKATEVLLTAGDVLYVPPLWLHYISILDRNIQCNGFSRRKSAMVGIEYVQSCGFFQDKKKKKEK